MNKKERLEMVARHVLTREGLSGFTMERLAEAAGVSRPTAYQYFRSREGALSATAVRTLELCGRLFEASQRFQGEPREQALAQLTGFEMLARFEPDHLEVMEFLGMPWIKDDLAPGPLETLKALVTAFSGSLVERIQLAVDKGHLELPAGYTVESAAFDSLNFYHGIFLAVVRHRITADLYGGEQPWEMSRRALHFFWNGLGWSPPPTDEEIGTLHERILRQCYPDYWLRIKTDELKRGLETPFPAAPPHLIIPERRRRGRRSPKPS